MGGTRRGDSTKKAAGMARKADVAAQKAAAEVAKQEADDANKWKTGTKSNSKKEAESSKKVDVARKKAERDALLAEEEASLPGRSTPKNSKSATKKTRGLDLSDLDSVEKKALPAVHATGIDNALEALSLTATSDSQIDKHPERRYPAARAKYQQRRLGEMERDGSGAGLRYIQKKEKIQKEFEKHPDNPFNQVSVAFNASKSEIEAVKQREQDKIERRLG